MGGLKSPQHRFERKRILVATRVTTAHQVHRLLAPKWVRCRLSRISANDVQAAARSCRSDPRLMRFRSAEDDTPRLFPHWKLDSGNIQRGPDCYRTSALAWEPGYIVG